MMTMISNKMYFSTIGVMVVLLMYMIFLSMYPDTSKTIVGNVCFDGKLYTYDQGSAHLFSPMYNSDNVQISCSILVSA